MIIVRFLAIQENEKIKKGEVFEGELTTPSYNARNKWGESPVFRTSSSRIVEMCLQFDDLAVTKEDGKPLLWYCAENGTLSEKVGEDVKLKGQYGTRWEGTLPFEIGEYPTRPPAEHK